MKNILVIIVLLISSISSFSQGMNSWVTRSSNPVLASTASVSFTVLDKAFIGTGSDSNGNFLDDFWEYNPVTDTWAQLADFSGGARTGAVGFAIDSAGYVGLGYDGNSYLKDLWKYSPLTNTWTSVQELGLYSTGTISGRRDAAVTVSAGMAYVIGGHDGTTAYVKQCWSFNPSADTAWTKRRNFANSTDFTVIGRRWGIAFTLQSLVYFGTGYDYTQSYKKDLWSYNTFTDSWSQVADFPGTARSNASAFALKEKGYVFCGVSSTQHNDMWRYDPVQNSWLEMTSYPGAATANNIAFVWNNRAFVGFGSNGTNNCQNDLWEYIPDSTIGITKIQQLVNFTFFPNPVKDHVKISISEYTFSTAPEFSLYSGDGKICIQRNIYKPLEIFPVGNLSEGIYFYKISHNGRTIQNGKIIVQN